MRHTLTPLAVLASLTLMACSQDAPVPADDDAAGSLQESRSAEAPTPVEPAAEEAAGEETATATASIDIEEWDVPWEGRPRDPYTLDGQTVWFVGQQNSYIARLDVASGEMERIDLREGAGRPGA